MKRDFYVDIHCHPTMKPFGQSFAKGGKNGVNNPNRKRKSSAWFYNTPSRFDKILNQVLKLTKFTQSDFSTGAYGNMGVICASLYPIERSFCRNVLGKSILSDLPIDFVSGFGKHRIDAIQAFSSASYCCDLHSEYYFLKELHDKEMILTDGKRYKYKLVNSFFQIQDSLTSEESVETTAVIVTIEGAHAFGCGIDNNADFATLEKNIKGVKEWEYPPFFVTFAHHFYNELCGHAESLSSTMKILTNQKNGINTSFTKLGIETLASLLDTSNGKRIFIDIKHMSQASRDQYYQILGTEYKSERIPIIASHACVQGNVKDRHKFNPSDINLSDKDLLKIVETNGLIGIQLDERRIASDTALRYARSFTKRSKLLYHWAALVWNQLEHIAELFDSKGYFAWGNTCLGTDFDGIIDPINGYWTHEDIADLETHLLMHAHNYMKSNPSISAINKIHEEEIVTRVMCSNAMEFFKQNFI